VVSDYALGRFGEKRGRGGEEGPRSVIDLLLPGVAFPSSDWALVVRQLEQLSSGLERVSRGSTPPVPEVEPASRRFERASAQLDALCPDIERGVRDEEQCSAAMERSSPGVELHRRDGERCSRDG
jgi:hypothetical protein